MSEAAELVARLRDRFFPDHPQRRELCEEAASALEEQAAEIERLREWATLARELIHEIDVKTARQADTQAGLLTAFAYLKPPEPTP